MDARQLRLFIAAALLLNLTPGRAVRYTVTNASRSGARASVVVALGITAGCFVHIFTAATAAFTALKWVGAACMVVAGARTLLARSPVSTPESAPIDAVRNMANSIGITWSLGVKSAFFQGFRTIARNPKVDEPPRVAESTRSDERGGLLVWMERGTGLMFMGFGVRLALADNPQHRTGRFEPFKK